MGRLLDLTGKRFGSLVAVERVGTRRGLALWECLCDCGRTLRTTSADLVHEHTKRCRNPIHKYEHALGKKFGRLTVIGLDERKSKKYMHVKCRCDCGKEKSIYWENIRKGYTKSCGCAHKEIVKKRMEGASNPQWKGGKWKSKQGYIHVHCPEHPNANKKGGYVLEHIAVMAKHIGRPLKPKETVHHLNGIRDDNKIENLELWSRQHGPGTRVEDQVEWATDFLEEYAPDRLDRTFLAWRTPREA